MSFANARQAAEAWTLRQASDAAAAAALYQATEAARIHAGAAARIRSDEALRHTELMTNVVERHSQAANVARVWSAAQIPLSAPRQTADAARIRSSKATCQVKTSSLLVQTLHSDKSPPSEPPPSEPPPPEPPPWYFYILFDPSIDSIFFSITSSPNASFATNL